MSKLRARTRGSTLRTAYERCSGVVFSDKAHADLVYYIREDTELALESGSTEHLGISQNVQIMNLQHRLQEVGEV